MTAVALPDASHVVITTCEGMDLNIVTRDDGVVLPRVEIEIEGDSDDEDGDEDGEGLSPEQVAAVEAQLGALVEDVKSKAKVGGDVEDAEGEGEWVDEDDEDDDGPPPPPRLESEIDPEQAPALYAATKVIDLEDLAFPNALLGVAQLVDNVETLRIKAVPSSGFLGEWPISFKNVIVWQNEMNYEYGPFVDDDSDYETEEEDEEEEDEDETKTEDAEASKTAAKDADDENDPDYTPGEDDDESDEEEETILCTSRFVLNITPSHPTTPRVTKALEDLLNTLNAPLDEITVIFNVDKEYKQPKDYEPSEDDEEEPPLLGFLLTLLTMCGSDDTKINMVDFDHTGVEWLSGAATTPKGLDATGIVPPAVVRQVFEEFINGGMAEVRDAVQEDGLGDVGTKRTITYVSRDEYKAAVGDAQFKLDTQWEK